MKHLILVLAVALMALLGAFALRGGPAPVEASASPSLDVRGTSIASGDEGVVTVFLTIGRVILRLLEEWGVDASALPRLVVRGVLMLGRLTF